MGKLEIDSGLKDYELKLLVQSPNSSYNVIQAEHRPSVFLGQKSQTKYLLVSLLSKEKYKEIGKLSFDESTPVYYDFKKFTSFSDKTRILPPQTKHALIVDLVDEKDFEGVTTWLRENKNALEGAFSQLYAANDGDALKGGVINFSIKSNEFELDSLRVYSLEKLDSVKWVSQIFWDDKNQAALYIDRDGDVVPQYELREKFKKHFRPQFADQKDFHSVARFSLTGVWAINKSFSGLSPEDFLKMTETMKNKKGEDIFDYFERVKKTIGFKDQN
jgi:hypothetical protein